MFRDEMIRMMLRTMLDGAIRDLAADPKRTVCKLLDTGRSFAAPELRVLLDTIQERMQREDSPYYELIQRVAAGTDPDTLKTVAVNVGYNSLAAGAKRLREQGETDSLGWLGKYDLADGCAGLELMIRNKPAVRTWILWGTVSPELPGLLRRNRDCAFLVFLTKGAPAGAVSALAACHNAALTAPEEAQARLSPILEENRCLWGVYGTYHAGNMARFNESWAKTVSAPVYCLVPELDCSQNIREEVRKFVRAFRAAPQSPFLLLDLPADFAMVGGLLFGRLNQGQRRLADSEKNL